MRLLLLGGTADARKLAENLFDHGIDVTYSIAGLVRVPKLPCKIISGGFTQFGSLAQYINDNKIDAVLNATHPYAAVMSRKASEAANACKIPCWRFMRPEWIQQARDDWQVLESWNDVLPVIANKQSIFLTAGQMDQKVIDQLVKNACAGQQQLLRTAVEPKQTLPDSMQWIKAIGPFSLEDELDIMKKHHVDVVVSKNSGGNSVFAKILAARELAVTVCMLNRPSAVEVDKTFYSLDQCEKSITLAFTLINN